MAVYTKSPADVYAPVDGEGKPRGAAMGDALVLAEEMVREIDGKAGGDELDAERQAREQAIQNEAQAREQAVEALEAADEALSQRIDSVEVLASSGVKWTTEIVRVRSTANVNLASGLTNGTTLNGVVLATGQHVFLGSQTNAAQNGIYTVVASGAASRATFADTAEELARIGFVIQEGTAGTGERWTLAMDSVDITVGTTPLLFSPAGIEPGYAAEVEAARDDKPTLGARIDGIADHVDGIISETIGEGMAATGLGDRFSVVGNDSLTVYEHAFSRNLYDTAAQRDGYYVSTGSGKIFAAAGFACSDFIPVQAGKSYNISHNTTRQGGAAFFSAMNDNAVVSSSTATNPAGVTLVAPAGAQYLVITVKAPAIPEPTEIMVVEGAVAFPYEPFGVAVGRELGAYLSSSLFGEIAEFKVSQNLYDPAAKRSGFYVNKISGNIAAAAGFACSDWIAVAPGQVITVSSNTDRQPEIGFFSAKNDTGSSVSVVSGAFNKLATVTVPAGASWMVINVASTLAPEPTEIMVNIGSSALPWEPYGDRWVIRTDALPGSVQQGDAVLRLRPGNIESTIDSSKSGRRIRNTFILGAPLQLLSYPQRLNLRATYLDNVLVRDFSDDVAPDVVMGANLGGNHGWMCGECTAAAHGKTAADQGSVWTSDSVEHVLVAVLNASTLVMAQRSANVVPTSGTYTHVSGGANTGPITISAVTDRQWYPSHNNYTVRVLVDGAAVPLAEADYAYHDSVQIIETGDILTRQSIIDWWIANGGVSAGLVPQGDVAYSITTTYHFDRDGQLSIYWDWIFLRAESVGYLRGLQVGLGGAPSQIYVPGAVPMSYDGDTIDLSRKVPADLTSTSGVRIWAKPANFQNEGEFGHRILSLWPNYVFAVGFLPVGDAAYDVRRDRVTGDVLDIATNGKQYFRLLDQGAQVAAVGDHYSAACFRHIVPRVAERTCFHIVRSPGGDVWIYADWHDRAFMDRLPIPADLIGREFEVEDSRNVTVMSSILTGSLPVMVAAAADYGYCVIRVK